MEPSEYESFTTFINYPDCSIVRELKYEDRCHYVRTTPECIERRFYFNYIHMLYCGLQPRSEFMQILGAFTLLLCCLVMFFILATTADRIFCPALKVMSHHLGLNEHLAGITLLAFGNGSPDLFTSLASISDETRMSFSDLFGAAIYVITLVGGIICLVAPFKLAPAHILRDLCFFMFGAVYIEYIIVSDGYVTIAESVGVLFIYVFFLIINLVDQILLKRHITRMERQYKRNKDITDEFLIELAQLRAEADVKFVAQGSSERFYVRLRRLLTFKRELPPNHNLLQQFYNTLNPIDVELWRTSSLAYRIFMVSKVPFSIFLTIFMPIVDYELEGHGWSKLLNSIQVTACPTIMTYAVFHSTYWFGLPLCLYVFVVSLPFSSLCFMTTRTDLPPSYHNLFALLSVVGSMIVIYSCASETVQIFYVLGIVTNVSNAFLGCTLLAWGNGFGDLVANTSLARSGLQNMGFAACFGGPLFNSLLAMGSTFLYRCIMSENGRAEIYQGSMGENCYIFLIISLIGTLAWTTSTNFVGRRSVGIFSILLYVLFLIYSVLGELEVVHTFARETENGLP